MTAAARTAGAIAAWTVALALAACSGSDGGGEGGAAGVRASLEGVSLTIEGVEDATIEAKRVPPGPPDGWSPTLTAQFLVDAPPQSVEAPARLRFMIDWDRDPFNEAERDPEQLNVFYGGLVITDECETDGQARPDPCIESRTFVENGDAELVVLASRPAAP